MKQPGLDRYYPEPTKNIIIVHKDNLKSGGLFGPHIGFTVCMGARYLGSYIGDDKSKSNWLKKRKDKWERNIRAVTKTAGKYPEEIYAAVAQAI